MAAVLGDHTVAAFVACHLKCWQLSCSCVIPLLPAVPFKQAGADAAVVASAKSYKLSFRPSLASVATATNSKVDAQQASKGTGEDVVSAAGMHSMGHTVAMGTGC